jgi:hypothetical protein
VQDTLDTLNSLGITEVNYNILQKMNESINEQREAIENQVKILKLVRERKSHDETSSKEL